jgi:acyl dehydratase
MEEQATPRPETLEQSLWDFYGRETRVSDWLEVEQPSIDRFAAATRDPDWMHIDPERARREGPFDGTIAFGFWTLSMLTYLTRSTLGGDYPPGVRYGFNYGLDRVRLMAPVPVGSRIRNHFRIVDIEDRGDSRFVVRSENRIEVEGEEKPAMIAVWLGMLVF